jgi:uncharacterized protein GlcG (DUF336 family)
MRTGVRIASTSAVACSAALALVVAVVGCESRSHGRASGTGDTSKGETQAGAANAPRESPGARAADCGALPSADQLRAWLKAAPDDGEAGGLAGGRFEWAAVVDRAGTLCALAVSTDDPAAAWPGSRGIAIAKAFTANAFSTDTVPLSSARLYTLSQPGHSLWGAAAGNPIDPQCLGEPSTDVARGRVCGGTIAFGGGVPLYKGSTRVGGLGASGDTACADHEIAKRIRDKAGLNPAGGPFADDITYAGADGASVYTHPLCPNTWRNGKKIGEEPPASGY